MKTNMTVRNELKKILSQVSTLSQQVSDMLDKEENVVDLSNELVKSSISFTFHLGHLYGVEADLNQVSAAPKSVKVARAVNVRYHNVRDHRGRFVQKATANV